MVTFHKTKDMIKPGEIIEVIAIPFPKMATSLYHKDIIHSNNYGEKGFFSFHFFKTEYTDMEAPILKNLTFHNTKRRH